ncbi:uncharacterized protein [Elaeis guineensis]|uniref:Uncharacterized protein LOC105059147 isoform X2 n=1 Tax=Elaeis guineensis var. tenera TaxID=51953 RepID=A0A6I9SC09_ELAGV|nr:uncharacterized protein LOC105059147 isoform X2 [Elaeis guineensis]
MATISAVSSSLHCRICRLSSPSFRPSPPPSSLASFASLRHVPSLALSRSQRRPFPSFGRAVRAVAEEETVVPEEEQAAAIAPEEESPSADPNVSVPVSPSDMLTILFKAEGTMDESAIPAVTKALEGTEGISDLKVQVAEGIASVEERLVKASLAYTIICSKLPWKVLNLCGLHKLAKQTTVQATGVASSLVETIQGSGFKLQTFYLSFEDEEDAID